ncbi:MAG: hypothetical protein RLZZ391_122 [Bacteroidota bacterium]|jgi:UDP-glucose 4-epimerase
MKKSILITGGLGFIGSHTAIELIQEGFDVVIVDNQVNSESFILDRIEQITGYLPVYYCLDVCDELAIEQIFENHQIDAVIHFAALKAVSESVEKPIKYQLFIIHFECHGDVQLFVYSIFFISYGIR